tara:strand:- start:2076 stop:5621 length:3546 start_codon:yes stop_codon:yes gene_type:complete
MPIQKPDINIYDASAHTKKKGRPMTIALKHIPDGEALGFMRGPLSTGPGGGQLLFEGGLRDGLRINLFENNRAGHPLSPGYSYDSFSTSDSYPPPIVKIESKKTAVYTEGVPTPSSIIQNVYHIRAHKKFTAYDSLLAPGVVASYPGDFTQDLVGFELLMPNNKIELFSQEGVNQQPIIDEFTYYTEYDPHNSVSYDFLGEYRPAGGIINSVTPTNSLVNLPFKIEYVYPALEKPGENVNFYGDPKDFFFFLPDANTPAAKKAKRNFTYYNQLRWNLFGEGGPVSDIIKYLKDNNSSHSHLNPEDQDFIETEEFSQAVAAAKGSFFDTSKIYDHVDFISSIPFSPRMAASVGIATENLLTAEIKAEFNFMPPQLSEIISSNNFLELEMPNFYNFMTAMVAVKEKKFDPLNANARRLTLGGRLDPSQLLFVGKQYADHQAASELPPGHAHWDYDNNKSLLDTEFVVQGVDYWQAWAANWNDYNNEKATTNYSPNLEKTILVPFENTNFLTDYNDNITYFPIYNQIEFDTPGEAPILPYLLKNAKADKYIMRCLAASVKSIRNGTDEDFTLTQGVDDLNIPQELDAQNNTQAIYNTHKFSPPGESMDYSYNSQFDSQAPEPQSYAEAPMDYVPWYGQGELSALPDQGIVQTGLDANDLISADGTVDKKFVSWELPMLLNGFKLSSDGWTENGFEHFDKQEAFYVGIDVENGYPFINDLSSPAPGLTFTKSLYSYILEQQLQSLAAQKFVHFNELQCGTKNYSEIVMFRIHKKSVQDINGETEQDIWMWNTGDVDRYIYYDTQIGYGHSYTYRVYAYYFVVGNRYNYISPKSENDILGYRPFSSEAESLLDQQVSENKVVLEVEIKNQTTLKIIELPYFGFEEDSQMVVTSTDNPPVPPSVDIHPFKNVSDAISITLTNNSGEFETNKIITLLSERPEAKDSSGMIVNYLFASDIDVLKQMRQSQNKPPLENTALKFKSDTLPAFYEIYRIGPEPGEKETKPPTSYLNFYDKLYQTIEVDGSSVTIIDDIEEGVPYYYTFRARDHAAGYFFSNPTAVYKVQMVREVGKNVVYPIIEIHDMDIHMKYKLPSKQMTRYMHIRPNYEHTVLDQGDFEFSSLEYYADKTTANPTQLSMIPKLGVNNDNYELFSSIKNNAKRFKIRLTSKSTGRKIDFNVAFLRKHNQD